MSLVPREPSDMLMPLREAMNRLFEESFIGPRFEVWGSRAFPLDVYESEDKQQYIVEASVSGFKPEDIQISAEGESITIRAMRKAEDQAGKGNYVRRERFEGEMVRSVTLPTSIDTQKIDASYENGVLTLRVPKAEGAKPRQIPVKVRETAH